VPPWIARAQAHLLLQLRAQVCRLVLRLCIPCGNLPQLCLLRLPLPRECQQLLIRGSHLLGKGFGALLFAGRTLLGCVC